MVVKTLATEPSTTRSQPSNPPFEAGDQLTRAEFHRRCEAYPLRERSGP